jgi:outer membrane protein, heavy metal efflux system
VACFDYRGISRKSEREAIFMRIYTAGITALVLIISANLTMAADKPNDSNRPTAVEPNRFLTPDDYVSYAESHNPGLKTSYQQWITANEEAIQAKSLPGLQFTQGTYAQETDVYERQMVIITQMFPWFGKISARAETAVRNAEAAKQKHEAARLSLIKDVKIDFYEYAYLTGAVAITKENIEVMRRFASNHPTADANGPDTVRLRAETTKLQEALQGLAHLCEPIVGRLKTALNLPAEMNLSAPQLKDFEPEAIDYGLLVNLLRQKNPELAGLNFEVMAAKSRVKLAEKNLYPDVGIGLQLEQMKRPGANTQESSRDAIIMFSVNLPLWQDSYKSEQRRAVSEATTIEQQRINAENNILARTSQVYYEYNDSIKRIELYREILIPKAQESLQAAETAYVKGGVDITALLGAQRAIMDYRMSIQRALADNRQTLAELEMLSGTDLDKQQ